MASSALRGLEILAFLAEQSAAATVNDIATGTGISRATAYRIVDELVKAGWLRPVEQTSRLGLSFKVAQLGAAAFRANRVRDVLLPHAIELARLTSRIVVINFYEDGYVIFTDAVEVIGDRVMPTLGGGRVPAVASGAGKILLALQAAHEVERVVARGVPKLGPNTKTDPAEIAADITITRERGYGIAHEEAGPGMGGLGVPVFDHQSNVAAAIGVHAGGEPVDGSFLEQVLAPAKMIAARASAELGYRSRVHHAVS
jgi:DNA-binding IclR family transcriptional regulator